MDTVYHDDEKTQPSSGMMTQNDPWTIYDAVAEEEEREFYKSGYPMVFDPTTGKCFVPRRDYERTRKDDVYRRMEAEWILKQIEEEEISAYHHEMNGLGWESIKRRYRRQCVRYRSIPRTKDVIVMSKMGKIELPIEDEVRIELVMDWLGEVPDGRRIGGNDNFGGIYKGMRPKSERGLVRIKAHICRVERLAREDKMLLWGSEDVIALKEDEAEEWVQKRFKDRMSV